MKYFPAFLDLSGRPALVVGGGELAARKVRLLLKAGARVTVVAPHIGAELAQLAAEGTLRIIQRGFVAGDVRGKALVHGATGRAPVDERVAEAARAAGVPVNVVDRPDLSSFIMPAIVERDPVVIGISTDGAAPLLARRIRVAIEALLPARLGRLARFAESFRGSLRATMPEARDRRRFWERFFDGPVAGAILAGDERGAREQMLSLVNRPQAAATAQGMVHIVGAGPGDPDLLTLRALHLMQQADIVVYDKLVGRAILDYVRRDAERIYVGKSKGNHARSQDEINALLVEQARAGKRVLRLKGGDPFIFGRGGEERAHLRRAGVRVEVVPGITAATGCAAATGIPLTHRDHAPAVTFVAGHGRNGEPDLDWAALARARHTLVIYMGVSSAGRTAARLIEHGMAPDTPAAIVNNGTLDSQQMAIGPLARLGALVAEHGIEGPAIIVVGEVVRAADAACPPERLHALAV